MPKIIIVRAGVDPAHQTDHCDDCGHPFDPANEDDEAIPTCAQAKDPTPGRPYDYLTLCRPCYQRRGNTVR
jgi:hypothetical protein